MKIIYIVTWCIISLQGHWSEPPKDPYGRLINPLANGITWSSENRHAIYDTLYDCNHEKQFYNRADAMKFIYEGAVQNDLTNFEMLTDTLK